MRAQKFTSAVAMVGAVSLMFLARSAAAEESVETIPDHPLMTDRWFFSAGAMYAESNVAANLNKGIVGTFVDFEDDFGLAKNDVIGLFDARWHFTKRWQLEVEYFSLDRSNEKQTQRVIDWGNLNIPVTTVATARFNMEDFRVSVGYAFFRSKDKEIGLGLGAHVAKLEAGLSTQNLGSEFASETAPLPFLTFYARVALTDRWLLSMRVDRLSLSTGNIDGSVFSSGVDVIYQPWRHFSVGLGYRDVNFAVKSTKSDWTGKAQIQENGPTLFIATSF